MEPEEVAALNHHHFRTFIKRNSRRLKDHRSDEDEDKEFNETMYLDEEKKFRPGVRSTSETIVIGDSQWTYNYSRKGTKLEMSFGLDQSKLATIAEVLVTAINHKDSSKLLVLSKNVTRGGIIRCNHLQVCQTNTGFMDPSGAVSIRLQIQARPDKPAIHSFHRHFRLQLYWFKKKMIDKLFSIVLKSTTTTYNKCKNGVSDSRWERYLEEASKDFSVKKDIFWKGLLDYCKGDYYLVDIVNSGSKLLANGNPPQVPFLIEAGEDDFHFIGSLGDLLSHASQLAYLPMHQLDAEHLTLERVLEFEELLLKNGYFVFQCFFINSKFNQSFLQYLEQQTEPDLTMDDESKQNIFVGDGKGGNSTEEKQPTDSDSVHSTLSDTKQDKLSKSIQAIKIVYEECLKPVAVAGAKYRENMKKIHAEYPHQEFVRELEEKISEWFLTAQEDAYYQFREHKEEINYANYIADRKSRKFVARRTAREKKAIKSEEETKKIGKMGEEHAHKYFTTKYEDQDLVVRWMNELNEAGHPFDLCVFENSKPKIFIEVKATSVLGRHWFHLTPNEYEFAKENKVNYIIAHVHINENEQDDKKKYTLTEYANPLKEGSELQLTMARRNRIELFQEPSQPMQNVISVSTSQSSTTEKTSMKS